METIRKYIFDQVAAQKLTPLEAKGLLNELVKSEGQEKQPIAIIGMACRYPGASSPDDYWSQLSGGVCSIGKFPDLRKRDIDTYLSQPSSALLLTEEPLENLSGDIYGEGAFLDRIDCFDASFFSIPPSEASFMDPYQRILLETAYEAMEDGGYGGKSLHGSRTGVFVGRDHTETPYYKLVSTADQLHLTGSYAGILSSRISYLFNLKGPSIVLDTACSSGLVAVHTACRSLQSKECDMAIAAGINLIFFPNKNHSLNMIESRQSRVRTFDNGADGTVLGEGAGVVLLKPLKQALLDRDHIYAVVRGSAINNDGASNGITAPNLEAQEEAIIRALEDAAVPAESISYIEAHGTGTALGDPIEIKGITNAFRKQTSKRQFCAIGSVKTNIGHTVGASGLASLMKVVLSLKNKEIPANLFFTKSNMHIPFEDSPLYVNDRAIHWESSNTLRRAGISSFGFSGTNCHLIVEEFQGEENKHGTDGSVSSPALFAFSAKSLEGLRTLAHKHYDYAGRAAEADYLDYCRTSLAGRGHYAYRYALVADSFKELKSKLSFILNHCGDEAEDEGILYGYHQVVPNLKSERARGDVTEAEKRQLGSAAEQLVEAYLADGSMPYDRNHARHLWSQVARLYIGGADLRWFEILRGQYDKCSIPTYPLERKRFWASPRKFADSSASMSSDLLHRLVSDSVNGLVFETVFDTRKHWVLSEHKILGRYVVPGTTYLEMVTQACRTFGAMFSYRNILFHSPLILNDDSRMLVQTTVTKPDANNEVKFTVASRQDDSWVVHVEGEGVGRQSAAPAYNLNEILQHCTETEGLLEDEDRQKPFALGPRWQNIRSFRYKGHQFLVELHLPDSLTEDLSAYCLHPALLDSAVNAVSQRYGNGMYLPLSYGELAIYKPIPQTFYCYHRLISNPDHQEAMLFDIALLDSEGEVIIEIKSFAIKRVNDTRLFTMDASNSLPDLHRITWKPVQMADISSISVNQKRILIAAFEEDPSREVIAELRNSGHEVTVIRRGERFLASLDQKEITVSDSEEDYDRALALVADSALDHVLCIPSWNSSFIPEEANDRMQRYMLNFQRLIKCLLNREHREHKLPLTILCQHANAVTNEEAAIDPVLSGIAAMGKIISKEYPQFICNSIDTDSETSTALVCAHLFAQDDKYLVSFRSGIKYVPHLVRYPAPAAGNEQSADGTAGGLYVVTGGLGGIGLEVSAYLASKEKAVLALLNRSRFPERDEWDDLLQTNEEPRICETIRKILKLEENGSRVLLIQADVTDAAAMERAVEGLRAAYGRIKGIVHCAGEAGQGFLLFKDASAIGKVLAPKIEGVYLLDHLTRNDPPDLFMMCSSAMSLTAEPGQMDYVAANAFMDAYSDYRNKAGLRTISINWPSWKDVGMAVRFGADADSWICAMSNSEAITCLNHIFESCSGTVVPGRIQKDAASKEETAPYFDYAGYASQGEKKQYAAVEEEKGMEITLLGRHNQGYSEVEKKLAEIWSHVLGVAEVSIYDNFYELGGDSILATKFIVEVGKHYPGKVNITDLFSHPSIAHLSQMIGERSQLEQATSSSVPEENESMVEILKKLESGMISIDSAQQMTLKSRTRE
ncbi:SDR family NAD(P)-dependent oxidoreductase [Paenibacillus oenotherae]|uniref:SDR family NAD(P)-dependent oxidoreductase n=1 Tax=Paenibacillus oenotherae TaxID=1435645 RepID=A0ABS7D6F8_9BACL|nr:SDR family NAD(P)-dependent oxidoreductase [Paenibacillus oenotherae]MBW7475086.1 SDR family NAD(P)-dependent oxidoreductase [Paenibacillus oenotherae]